MKNHLMKSILCIILLVAASGLAGCNKTYTTTDGATDISTGVHTLTGVKSMGTPMVFEGLQATVFGTPAKNPEETRVFVVTHGDRGKGDYLLDFAKRWSGDGVVTMVMARIGCEVEGRKSIGTHGSRDHYTDARINAFARGLLEVKSYYKTDNLVAMGHSGGAATLALILNSNPELLDGVVLVSLPSNMNEWRRHRMKHAGEYDFGLWAWTRSMSPDEHVHNISPKTKIVVVTGSRDRNTPPWLAQLYVSAVQKTGKQVTNIVVPGGNHNLRGPKRIGSHSERGKAFRDLVYPEIAAMLGRQAPPAGDRSW
jgi:dienelactone hydrolase/predicted small secreted protein